MPREHVREAFMAYANSSGKQGLFYVVKKFKESLREKSGKVHQMTLEQHMRKQIQMHKAAKAIIDKYAKQLKLQNNREMYGLRIMMLITLSWMGCLLP